MGVVTIEGMKKLYRSSSELQRRDRVSNLLKIYGSDWTDQLDDEIARLFLPQNYEKLKLRGDISLNLIRWATDTIGAIYSKPVNREIAGDPSPWDRFRDMDLALDTACKLLYLCREMFIRPIAYSDGSIVLDIMTPDRVAVIPSKSDPWGMDALLYSVDNEDRFILWTHENHVILDSAFNPIPQADNPENLNPYGLIPWVFCHSEYPTGATFNDKASTGLRSATLSAAVAKTDHAWLRHLQSFKQLVFTGMNDESAVRAMLDPSTALCIKNPAATVTVLDTQANLKAHLSSILDDAAATLNLYGIRPDMVKGTLSAQSGYALMIQMHETQREWENQRQIWRVYERQLYDIARLVVDVDLGQQMAEGEISINYAEIGPAANPQEEALYYKTLIETNMISRRSAMMRLLDMTSEQVDQEFDEMGMERREMSVMNIPPMPQSAELDLLESTGEIADMPILDTGTEKAADTALNGAQVAAAMGIVERVALGALPRQTGVEMLIAFFQLSDQAANKIMGSVGGSFTPPAPDELGQV